MTPAQGALHKLARPCLLLPLVPVASGSTSALQRLSKPTILAKAEDCFSNSSIPKARTESEEAGTPNT